MGESESNEDVTGRDDAGAGKHRRDAVIALAGALAIFVLYQILHPEHSGDERIHLMTIEVFRDMLLGNREWTLNYKSTIGPVYFFAYGIWSLVSVNLIWLRILSLLFCVLGYIALFRRLRGEMRDIAVFVLAACAGMWTIKSTVTIYSEQLTQLFVIVSVVGLTRDSQRSAPSWPIFLIGMLALTFVPLTRAYSIFVFPVVFLDRLFERPIQWHRLVLLGLTGIPSLILWYQWQGLTPPAFRYGVPINAGRIQSDPSHFWRMPAAMAYLGLFLLPWLYMARARVKEISKVTLGLIVVGACITFLVFHKQPEGPYQKAIDQICGVVGSVLGNSGEGLSVWASYAMRVTGLVAIGVAFDLAIRGRYIRDPRVQQSIAAFILYPLSLVFSGAWLYERYLLPMNLFVVMFGWVVTQRSERSKWVFLPYLAIGLVHLVVESKQM